MIQHYQGVGGHGHTLRRRSELTSTSLSWLRKDAFHDRQPWVPFFHLLCLLATESGARAQAAPACVHACCGMQNRSRDHRRWSQNRHRSLRAVCGWPAAQALCASAKRSDPRIRADLFTTVAHAEVTCVQHPLVALTHPADIVASGQHRTFVS